MAYVYVRMYICMYICAYGFEARCAFMYHVCVGYTCSDEHVHAHIHTYIHARTYMHTVIRPYQAHKHMHTHIYIHTLQAYGSTKLANIAFVIAHISTSIIMHACTNTYTHTGIWPH